MIYIIFEFQLMWFDTDLYSEAIFRS